MNLDPYIAFVVATGVLILIPGPLVSLGCPWWWPTVRPHGRTLTRRVRPPRESEDSARAGRAPVRRP